MTPTEQFYVVLWMLICALASWMLFGNALHWF